MPRPAAPIAVPATSPSHVSAHDQQAQNLKGIVLMALGFFSLAACDTQAKLLTAELPPFQVAWFRQLGLLIGVLALLAVRGPGLLRSARPVIQIGRGLTAAASAAFFIYGVGFVPLADAVAVTFISPFIVTILGAVMLGEHVGLRRWIAVAVGFIGMLIVIRPGMGVFHPAIFFIVGAACTFGFRQVLSRWLSGADGVMTTVAYTSISSSLVLSFVLPFVWETPDSLRVWAICAGMAICAGLGEVFIIRALDIGQAVALAPVHYTMILWGSFYGYLIFGELPDLWTIVGCAIIVASGLYTVHRERLRRAEG
ncbi:carboxylate/amino acid/amine transporter [Marinibacterium anthonyi]|nr:EamA family transporter [Paracoccaceae bacterium]QEW21691.1 carboxylate/amino acid/amine transporter [Marinibacterium anthonyi]